MKQLVALLALPLAGCAAPYVPLAPIPEGASKSLAFVVLADTHIGEGPPRYAGEENAVTERLRAAVARINHLARTRGVEGVFIVGDITHSAERAEFVKARELLDGLEVPYYPVLGNHDVWPYTEDSEASSPSGDRLFFETFADLFAGIPYTGAERVWDPVQGERIQLQNFALVRGELAFLGLDWNTRQHAALTYPGAHPQAEVHDYRGGTLPWLRRQLAALPPTVRRVFFFQHHPFRMIKPVPDWIYGFDDDEKAAFRRALEVHPAERYGAVFAGHQHRASQTTAFDELPTFMQIETAACKETAAVTLVEVYEGGAFTVTRIAPLAAASATPAAVSATLAE